MRYILILSVFFIFFASGCKEDSLSKTFSQKITIQGKLTEVIPDATMTLVGQDATPIKVGKDGSFVFNMSLGHSAFFSLIYDQVQIPIYVQAGNKVNVIINPKEYRGAPKFTGDHAAENLFLQSFEEFKSKQQPSDYKALYTLDEKSFIDTTEQMFTSQNQFTKDYQQKNGTFSDDFAKTLNKEIDFLTANSKLTYPSYYKFFEKEKKLMLSDSYDSFLQNIDLDEPANLQLPAYRDFVKMYIEYMVSKEEADTSKTDISKSFEQVSKHFKDDKIKSYLYHVLIKDAIAYNVNDVAPLMSEYSALQTNESYLKETNKAFDVWKPLLAGSPAPDFTYQDIRGKSIPLSSLKGKVVYIDVWATWCGPCLAELPHLESLQEIFKKNKDIAFMSVSIDQDKAAWQKMVKEKSMKGLQLIADQDWKSSIVRDYHIEGIPRFIIIGKDGNIIDANAARPSNEKLTRKLTKALI